MRKIGYILGILALVSITAAPVLAQGTAQTTCPVKGGTVKQELYTDYNGQRVYFCTPACREEFKRNPDTYLQKMKSQGTTLESIPAAPAPGSK
jgi:YHS domain-containing protein